MNVLFDCERMKHPYTGLYEYCSQLGLALQQTAQDNHIFYYTPKGLQTYFGEQAAPYIYDPIHQFFPLRVKDIQIWQTHAAHNFIRPSTPCKRVLTIHDLNFLHEKKGAFKERRYLRSLQSSADRADCIVAISEFTKNDILAHLNIKDKPIEVIYNGCNVLEFPTFDDPLYRPRRHFLFSLGTVLPKKNFHVLPCLLKGNDYELIIAGQKSAEYEKRIISEARKHGVESRVKLIGTVSLENKYWYLKNCFAFLFPSIAEGFGIPPIEAMHFGKPVFLSHLTSLPEIGGRWAYYFESFDAEQMCEVFQRGINHYLETGPRQEIVKHADGFNWTHSAKQYWSVYNRLL